MVQRATESVRADCCTLTSHVADAVASSTEDDQPVGEEIPHVEAVAAQQFLLDQRQENVGGIAILPAAPVRMRSRDVEYIYRQDSDFYYLTGFAEPEAVAVLVPGRPQGEYLLFCRERDPSKEQWDGSRAGQDGAIADFAADDAFPIEDIDDIIPGLIEGCERVYYTMGMYTDFDGSPPA